MPFKMASEASENSGEAVQDHFVGITKIVNYAVH